MGVMNHHFLEQNDIVFAAGPVAPSSMTAQRVSFKNFQRATVLILQNQGSTNPAAISLKQCKEIDDSPVTEKVLPFTEAYRSVNVGTQAAPVNNWEKFTVSGDTFNTNATNGARSIYAIDIKAEDLDVANDFDIMEVEVGNAASNVLAVLILMHEARNGGFPVDSAILD